MICSYDKSTTQKDTFHWDTIFGYLLFCIYITNFIIMHAKKDIVRRLTSLS